MSMFPLGLGLVLVAITTLISLGPETSTSLNPDAVGGAYGAGFGLIVLGTFLYIIEKVSRW
jgi:hypothetical protein